MRIFCPAMARLLLSVETGSVRPPHSGVSLGATHRCAAYRFRYEVGGCCRASTTGSSRGPDAVHVCEPCRVPRAQTRRPQLGNLNSVPDRTPELQSPASHSDAAGRMSVGSAALFRGPGV